MNKVYGVNQSHLVMYRLLMGLRLPHDTAMGRLAWLYESNKRLAEACNAQEETQRTEGC